MMNCKEKDSVRKKCRHNLSQRVFRTSLLRRLGALPLEPLWETLTNSVRGCIGSERIQSLLFLSVWGIGDAVLLKPGLKEARRVFPNAKITLAGKPFLKELYQLGEVVDEIREIVPPWSKRKTKYAVIKNLLFATRVLQLPWRGFDLAISDRADPWEHLLMWLLGAKKIAGYDFRGHAFLTNPLKSMCSQEFAVLHKSLSMIATVRRTVEDRAYELLPLLPNAAGRYASTLLIHAGGEQRVRQWPEERYIELVKLFLSQHPDWKVQVIIGPDGAGGKIAIPGDNRVAQLSSPDLRKARDQLSRGTVLLCNNSGIMHLACESGLPVVEIASSTYSPWFKAWSKRSTTVRGWLCPHYPCGDYCRYDIPRCILSISVEDVLSALEKVVREVRIGQ
jgi:ADP-heptose:LPS heptosyltransferase